MGIFDSIKQGLTSAGHFLVQNSGTILNAAETVAKVAGVGLFAVADIDNDVPQPEELIADFLPNFRAANDYVIAKAQAGANKQASPLTDEGVSTQKDLLDGVWELAAPTTDGKTPPAIYKDIAAFLQASNIPTYINLSRSGSSSEGSTQGIEDILDIFDIAENIANLVFSDFLSAKDNKSQVDDRGVRTISFQLPMPNVGCTITGSHAYYLVPMGHTAGNFALHSALVIHTIKTLEFTQAESAKRRAGHIQRTSSPSMVASIPNMSDSSLMWMVTLQIQWSTVQLAVAGTTMIKQNLSSDYKITDQQLYGSTEVIKVLAASTSSPALVRQAVIEAITAGMAAMPHGSTSGSGLSASANVQLPSVDVTSAVLVRA